jgi:cobalt/nickel transport system ATP-binding protein
MGMSDGVLIQLRNVRFAHAPDRRVLDGVNLSVREGDRIAVTGPNGSGKTTLLHLMVGLLHPQEGEIEVLGRARRVEEDFHEVRAHVGLLFQDSEDQLFCPTVAEDVAFGPFNLGKAREEVERIVRETLERLGLQGYEERVTYRLSFGEKRLVALATVLAMQPRVLLLDEPTNGLDSAVWERLAEFLGSLETTMVIVSHDTHFLKRVVRTRAKLSGGLLTGPERL